MATKVLATDVYVDNPEGGASVCLKAGTKESDLPDWVKGAKTRNAAGKATDEPLLGDHVWAKDEGDSEAVAAGQGVTAGFEETPTDTRNEPQPEVEPKSKPQTRR